MMINFPGALRAGAEDSTGKKDSDDIVIIVGGAARKRICLSGTVIADAAEELIYKLNMRFGYGAAAEQAAQSNFNRRRGGERMPSGVQCCETEGDR